MDGDTVLDILAVPGPDERERTTIPDRREDPTPEERGIEDRVNAAGNRIAHSSREALPARHHDVRADAAHELLVGRARVGQDPKPSPLRERDHVGGEQARSPRDEERRPGWKAEELQAAERGQPVHRQRRGLLEARASRNGRDGGRGHHQEL